MAVLRISKPFTDSVVLVAFPGLGYVGTIAGRYIVEKLELKWVGYLQHNALPPIGKVKDGNLLYPVNVFSGNGFHVILSEVSIPEESVWQVASAIVSRAKKDRAKYLLVLSGVLINNEDAVYGIPSNNTARKLMETYSLQPIENGLVTGVSAAILLLSKEMGIPALMVLGPARNPQDFEASIKVISFLSRVLSVNIPVEELVEMAHQYEHEINLLKKRSKPDIPMYG